MTNPIDDKINEESEAWEQEHHKTERERVRLSDARWSSVGRFFKLAVYAIAGGTLAGGLAFGAGYGVQSCTAWQAEGDAEEAAVDLFYDEQRLACINDHGREQCEIWFEIGRYGCKGSSTLSDCVNDPADARAEKLRPVP